MVWAKVDFNVCTQSGKQSDGPGALPAWGELTVNCDAFNVYV